MKFGPDVSVEPTDSYISILRRKSKFAIVATTATRMDVGLKLKGDPASDRLALGAELDGQLAGWLREAYDRAT